MHQIIELLKYLGPFAGVLIGWFLSRQHEKGKMIQEDKRTLKNVLYFLLEMRSQLNLYVVDQEEWKSMNAIIKKRFPISDSDERILKSIVSKVLPEIVIAKISLSKEDIEALNNNFASCVSSLSEIDPILASRLSSRQNIKALSNPQLEKSRLFISDLLTDVKDANELNLIVKELEPRFLREMVSDLEQVLIEIALKIDKLTVKKVRERLTIQTSLARLTQIEYVMDRFLGGLPPR
jgi:hypothetical protein